MKAHQTLRWGSEQWTAQRLDSSQCISPFLKQYLFYKTNLSHNVVSLSCPNSGPTLISHDTSTYYSISPSSSESDITQPHYLWLIVKQHLCGAHESGCTEANITLPAHLLTHIMLNMIASESQATQVLVHIGNYVVFYSRNRWNLQ